MPLQCRLKEYLRFEVQTIGMFDCYSFYCLATKGRVVLIQAWKELVFRTELIINKLNQY